MSYKSLDQIMGRRDREVIAWKSLIELRVLLELYILFFATEPMKRRGGWRRNSWDYDVREFV